MVDLKVKRLSPDAVLPVKAHDDDAGFDLTATWMKEDILRNVVTYGFSIAMEIPKGYVGLVFPRSSIYKVQLDLSNCVGVVEPGDINELKAVFRIVQPHIRRYGIGDVVAKLIIIKTPDVLLSEVTTF